MPTDRRVAATFLGTTSLAVAASAVYLGAASREPRPHELLIFYKAHAVAGFELRVTDNLAGTLVYLVIYTMLVTTFSGPRRAIGLKAWRILHKMGLYLVTLAFLDSQRPRSFDELDDANWWLLGLFAIAFAVRLAAFFVKRAAIPGMPPA